MCSVFKIKAWLEEGSAWKRDRTTQLTRMSDAGAAYVRRWKGADHRELVPTALRASLTTPRDTVILETYCHAKTAG